MADAGARPTAARPSNAGPNPSAALGAGEATFSTEGRATLPAGAVRGRFAPSPSGRMHAGNVFAALCAWLVAHASGGEMVLRIEDLDRARSHRRYADQVMRDFEALGLVWDDGPFYQQGREERYREAFARLEEGGLAYPCFCTRASLRAASAPHAGERRVYAGTCRELSAQEARARAERQAPAWRIKVPDSELQICDLVQGAYRQSLASDCGDFVVRRADGSFAYQLAVVLDDADQGITSVVRGFDLLSSTPQQRFLQQTLGLPAPQWAHVPLLCAPDGRRLSKRDGDAALDALLQQEGSGRAVIGRIAFVTGMQPEPEPTTPDDLLKRIDVGRMLRRWRGVESIIWPATS
ncbi:tRNA glutamyl-Q(34) synthetase GluQRS [Berryella wangjianweii]|uniref:Glutamyl-Q tRNA(Asp) synthetase n=1 Tax=Berryella wangjianweii TaxID=2734634 RepID=A0A6M8IWA5_9ACTN|nr:tRNA glutamyl-Q(34) synthetase GluQRS [Berryella wangjianweii]